MFIEENMKKQDMNSEIIKAWEAIDAGMPVSEVMRRLNAVKIKGDPLEGFTGSPPFHLDRLAHPLDGSRTRMVIAATLQSARQATRAKGMDGVRAHGNQHQKS